MKRLSHLPRRALPWALLALLLAGPAQAADGRWSLCRPSDEPIPLPELGAEGDQALRLSADEASAQDEAIARFKGDVVMLRAGKRIEAQQAEYDKNSDELQLQDEVRLYTRDMTAEGTRARFNLKDDSGELHEARYHFRSAHASGGADTITIRDPQYTQLSGATYTTCNPEQVVWQLKARQIDLDDATNTGEARNVTVELKGVPVFYLPYLNFPLHGRKSGLLAPSLGSSDKAGTDISAPWYWNIAPNYDATLAPRVMTKRGAMLQSEFRYLHPSDRGQVNLDVLPGDKVYAKKDRLYGSLRHSASFGDGWSNSTLYTYVSDIDYFNDLGGSQGSASQTHLERHFDLAYQGQGWNFLGRLQGYQTLSGSEPYQRLPQLRLTAATPRQRNRLRYSLGSELVHFAHHQQTPTGTRIDLTPAVSLPLEGSAWFLTPRLAWRHTQYQLTNTSTGATPSRTLPIVSLDSGLFFERDLTLGGRALLQTLEPRLYYLNVPYHDQTGIPVFDSGTYDFSFAQMFRDNRFSGADRQGDANQVTVALTSRLQDAMSGDELVRASIGQIHYFSDRRVTLPGGTVAETQTSDVVAELGARPARGLDLSASARWNPHQERSEVVTTRLRYRPEERKLLSLDYRFRRDQSLRQTDLIAYWPLTPRWRFLGRWNYDLEIERTLETIAGLAYDSCCWALHFVTRARLDTTTLDINHSFMLTLELKGLSSFGRRLEDELERGILGNL